MKLACSTDSEKSELNLPAHNHPEDYEDNMREYKKHTGQGLDYSFTDKKEASIIFGRSKMRL